MLVFSIYPNEKIKWFDIQVGQESDTILTATV